MLCMQGACMGHAWGYSLGKYRGRYIKATYEMVSGGKHAWGLLSGLKVSAG